MDDHVELDRKVAFLRRPDTYSEEPDRVETVETHMAWVFLTDRRAYKLKKPVKLPFLDFSTLERREEDCRLEVELNRRLADGVYLGTVPLTIQHGEMKLGGEGKVVDWLVQMRRLPGEKMLDERIRQETITEDEIRRIAVLLADFYRRTPPEPLTGPEYVARLDRDLRRNHEALLDPSYDLPRELVESVCATLFDFIDANRDMLAARAADGHVLEAHGDLRPEHICLETRPVIFDCLEFNRDFRVLDTADELSFLAMECDRLGATFVGPLAIGVYEQISGDGPPQELLAFYKMHRACLRAKLAVWHLSDHGVDVEKWTSKALEYLRHAASYMAQSRRPAG